MDKVYCDSIDCRGEFHIDLKVEELEDGIEQHYFTCPECNRRYDSYKTSPRSRELKIELDEESKKYQKKVTQKRWEKIQKIKRKLKFEMERVNGSEGV